LQGHAAYRANAWAILLNLRMHRAGVDDLVLLEDSRIAFQRHAAPGTTAWRVAFHPFAHRAEVFLSWLTRLRRHNTGRLISVMAAATGMCGRITVSVSFHSVSVRC